jgi:hypothetical protein
MAVELGIPIVDAEALIADLIVAGMLEREPVGVGES